MVLLAAAISCSSDGGDEPEMTPEVGNPTIQTIQPTATPELESTAISSGTTPEPTSSPRPSIAPEASPAPTAATPDSDEPTPAPLPPVDIDIASLTVPVCRTSNGTSNGAGFGTIPHATPTAMPEAGSSSGTGSSAAQSFVIALNPLVAAIVASTRAADDAWRLAESDEDLARIVVFEGRRLSQLCSALSIVPLTTDGMELTKITADALHDRRALLAESAELLMAQTGEGRAMDAVRQDSSAILIGLKANLDAFASGARVTSVELAPFTVVNPLLDLRFDAPGGWLAVRNGIDIVIMGPIDQQVYTAMGLGPDAWKLGTAMRIRRFRNNSSSELSDAAATLDSLYARFGDRTHEQSVEVGGVAGILRVYSFVDRHWDTFVATTIVDDQTYLFEHGCPTTLNAQCVLQLDGFIQSVVFADN